MVAAGGFFGRQGPGRGTVLRAAGVAMGTRFLLTSDSTVPDAVKQRYLEAGLDGTVVSTRGGRHAPSGIADRARGEAGKRLAHKGFQRSRRQRREVQEDVRMTWATMIRDGLAMRHGKQLTWSQVVMAANTPMLLKAGLVDGNTGAGVLASGQVAGIIDDLPSLRGVDREHRRRGRHPPSVGRRAHRVRRALPLSRSRSRSRSYSYSYSRSMIVTFAVPPPSHMVCRP